MTTVMMGLGTLPALPTFFFLFTVVQYIEFYIYDCILLQFLYERCHHVLLLFSVAR